MVDTKLLKSEIIKQGYNQKTFCKKIGMTESTFSRRMRTGVFKTDEAGIIIKELKLKNANAIFFGKKITCKVIE